MVAQDSGAAQLAGMRSPLARRPRLLVVAAIAVAAVVAACAGGEAAPAA